MIGQQLTDEQLVATRAGVDGAWLIAAGPGTGKTFTMVERFQWLVLDMGLRPDSILTMTFTDAAAAELRERLQSRMQESLEEAWIGTFHGLCGRLLREHAYLIGLPRDLRALDDLGQRLLLERLQSQFRSGAEPGLEQDFKQLQADDLEMLIKALPNFSQKLKGRGVSPEQFRRLAGELHTRQQHPTLDSAQAELEAIDVVHTFYSAYERRLREAGRLDFDDLILQTIHALHTRPEFQSSCRQSFRHILVDEFQDTNRIQLQLIELLAAPGFGNVTVVGDAKQSIYGWRDAEIENIRTGFPGRPLPLTVNRRSRQEILDCATDLIRRDPDFCTEQDLVATRGAGGRCVTVMMAADAGDEARLVAAEIERLVQAGASYQEIALLTYSTRRLPPEFEQELRRRGIPYVTSGGSGFFDREETKDVLALVRLVADPLHDGALARVLQGPVIRLDDAAMYGLASRRFGRWGMRLRDCLDASRVEDWPELSQGRVARVERTLTLVDDLAPRSDQLSVADALNQLLEGSGYLRHCQLRSRREGPRSLRNVRKVFELANRYEAEEALGGIAGFVGHLDRVMAGGDVSEASPPEAEEAVRLLTIHGAKGLEFGTVFLLNVRPPKASSREQLFFDPELGFVMKRWKGATHPRYELHTPDSAAKRLVTRERRRAVYVALTRARDALYISASRSESEPAEITSELEPDDHFGELLAWALDHPAGARVVNAEQLQLGGALAPVGTAAPVTIDVEAVIRRLELLQAPSPPVGSEPHPPSKPRLSFSQLHQFEVCPVRYRFQQVWQVPAPPDELLPPAAGSGAGGLTLGAAVHEALAAWHTAGGDICRHYTGPAEGRQMLLAYAAHPLARARTLATETDFTLRLGPAAIGGEVVLRGVADRICESDGRTFIVDYKTNANLNRKLRRAYGMQLQLYGIALEQGLLPGQADGYGLALFDLRRGHVIEVEPNAQAARDWVAQAAHRIGSGDFQLGPQHHDRPCFMCAYRPICADRR